MWNTVPEHKIPSQEFLDFGTALSRDPASGPMILGKKFIINI